MTRKGSQVQVLYGPPVQSMFVRLWLGENPGGGAAHCVAFLALRATAAAFTGDPMTLRCGCKIARHGEESSASRSRHGRRCRRLRSANLPRSTRPARGGLGVFAAGHMAASRRVRNRIIRGRTDGAGRSSRMHGVDGCRSALRVLGRTADGSAQCDGPLGTKRRSLHPLGAVERVPSSAYRARAASRPGGGRCLGRPPNGRTHPSVPHEDYARPPAPAGVSVGHQGVLGYPLRRRRSVGQPARIESVAWPSHRRIGGLRAEVL